MKKFAVKALFLSLVGFLAFTFVTRQVLASTIVNTANPHGWAFQVQSSDGSGTFVSGPVIPPLGSGSARLFTGTNGNTLVAIHNSGFVNTDVANITSFSYSTYSVSQSQNGRFPKAILDVSTDFGVDELIFNPEVQSQSAVLNTWQNWNAEAGTWHSTLFPNFSGGTLPQYAAYVGSASGVHKILNRNDGTGGVRLQVGPEGGSDVLNANVDNFTIGISGSDTTYDFEPDAGPIPTPTPTPSLDTDNDGFLNTVEDFIGTDPTKACSLPGNLAAWPPDIDKDGIVSILDLSRIAQAYGSQINDPRYNARYNLDADGVISILDLARAAQYFGKSCVPGT